MLILTIVIKFWVQRYKKILNKAYFSKKSVILHAIVDLDLEKAPICIKN